LCNKYDTSTCEICNKNSFILNAKCYAKCPDGYFGMKNLDSKKNFLCA